MTCCKCGQNTVQQWLSITTPWHSFSSRVQDLYLRDPREIAPTMHYDTVSAAMLDGWRMLALPAAREDQFRDQNGQLKMRTVYDWDLTRLVPLEASG